MACRLTMLALVVSASLVEARIAVPATPMPRPVPGQTTVAPTTWDGRDIPTVEDINKVEDDLFTRPLIALDGTKTYVLGVSNETYVDPGALCYFGRDETESVTTNAKAVDLSHPGSYEVTFSCKASTGAMALPETRTVIVDEDYEDYWSGHFQIMLAGYTVEEANQHLLLIKIAIAESVAIPEDCVAIENIIPAAGADDYYGTKAMQIGTKEELANSIIVQFKVEVTQEALITSVVRIMTADKGAFLVTLAKAMHANGMKNVRVEGGEIKMEEKVVKAAVGTFALGGAVGMAFFVGAAYKLKKLAASGNVNLDAGTNTDGSSEERRSLNGGL